MCGGDKEGGASCCLNRRLTPPPSSPLPQHADAILADADVVDVAFCVVGDPFGATTHADLALRAREAGVEVKKESAGTAPRVF